MGGPKLAGRHPQVADQKNQLLPHSLFLDDSQKNHFFDRSVLLASLGKKILLS